MQSDESVHRPSSISRVCPFDFTPCFEDTVLFLVPLGLLIALSLFCLWHLSRLSALHHMQRIITWLLWAKLVCVRVSACSVVHTVFPYRVTAGPPWAHSVS